MDPVGLRGGKKRDRAEEEDAGRPKQRARTGYYCAVPLCTSRSGVKTDLSFHRFPANPDLRKRWICAILRDVGANFVVTSNTRVCGEHFKGGDYRRTDGLGLLRLVDGAVPSVFAWSKPATTRRRLERAQPLENKLETQKEDSAKTPSATSIGTATVGSSSSMSSQAEPDCQAEQVRTPQPSLDHDYCLMGHGDGAARKILELEEELLRLKARLVTLEAVKDDQKKFSMYTGLPNYETFVALLKYLEPKAKRLTWWRGMETLHQLRRGVLRRRNTGKRRACCKISVDEQLFVVLVRLRTGAMLEDLAHRHDLPSSTLSKLFTTWIDFLAYELTAMHKFPSTKPRILINSFRTFPHTRIVIDCTEIFTTRPSSLASRKQLFSNYKHHCTMKFLVGISPSGAILYVSDMWGGRASDQKITNECGLINLLSPGQDVMADRGFTVDLSAYGVQLHIPAFLGSKRTQLTATEVTQSRRIAEARIHIECAIERIKEFRILSGEVDVSLFHVLEQVFQVCSYLTNFRTSIVKDVSYVS